MLLQKHFFQKLWTAFAEVLPLKVMSHQFEFKQKWYGCDREKIGEEMLIVITFFYYVSDF